MDIAMMTVLSKIFWKKWRQRNFVAGLEGIASMFDCFLISGRVITAATPFLVYLFIYSYIHTLFGPSILYPPTSSLFPPPPSLPGRTFSALFSNFVEEET
jgi:hypothetical protein